ncbi:hypothetical protein SS50377_25351 [Spironucleus salmonicida]|uniref:Uncharacterized protein n=1 Tax=Spironucleus salmonicida TaxID=348837 RepID=V6LBI4_9EUKA|nr:hypothetical protein SS50377_25351 [Spironucleus salmonicida]|eukprot:EST41772.1 Hypothetical protein SS50377_18605 [Spironucleus salmonicida]
MEIVQSTNEPSLQQKGEALNLQFQLFSDLTNIRMLIEPIREISCRLPMIEIDQFQSVEDQILINQKFTNQIQQLQELELQLLVRFDIQTEDDMYKLLQPYQKQTDLKIIQQPVQTQVNYALMNQFKLVKRSQQNTLNYSIIGSGNTKEVQDAAGQVRFEKVQTIIKEYPGIYDDSVFFSNILKLSSAQSGNLDEIKKLQGLVLQRRKLQKEYVIGNKNKSIDTATIFKKIVGFVDKKHTGNDQEFIEIIKKSIFGQ